MRTEIFNNLLVSAAVAIIAIIVMYDFWMFKEINAPIRPHWKNQVFRNASCKPMSVNYMSPGGLAQFPEWRHGRVEVRWCPMEGRPD